MASVKAKSLLDLETQIAALQKRAAQVRSQQYKKAIAEIAALMRAFGITLDEVKKAAGNIAVRVRSTKGGKRRRRPSKSMAQHIKTSKKANTAKSARKGKISRRAAAVKYRGPGGETWSGRGKQPVWLRTLLDAGRKIEDFRL